MKVSRVGDTLAVLLPDDVAEQLGLNEGDEVDVLPAAKPVARSQAEIDAAFERLKQLRGRLPAGYKFHRSDAYEHGEY